MALQLFKIASTTVETPQATIDFTSIPSGYTDLKLVLSTRRNGAGVDQYLLTFNSNTSSYSDRTLEGNGATVTSGSRSAQSKIYVTGIVSTSETSNVFGSTEIYIPNYTSSNYKSISADSVTENNGTTAYADFVAGLWANTAAITSISLGVTGQFVAGSTATLYGVL